MKQEYEQLSGMMGLDTFLGDEALVTPGEPQRRCSVLCSWVTLLEGTSMHWGGERCCQCKQLMSLQPVECYMNYIS